MVGLTSLLWLAFVTTSILYMQVMCNRHVEAKLPKNKSSKKSSCVFSGYID